ncbi:MAG: hypothetical protein KatS3mg076_3174 [Candidatus Binatia bacterium]|nr:MAG: hypothetical protein KatS3mg076_3174 [Candidatus Binatia bacterium]
MTSRGDRPPSVATPSLEDVKATLRRLIEENAGIPASSIRDDSTIDGDLAMDSLSFVSLQVAVEEEYDISCDPEEIERRNRFDAIAQLVHELVLARSGS